MRESKKDIRHFIQLLSEHITIEKVNEHNEFFEVHTDRVTLFMYKPHTHRVEEVAGQEVIHLDYDQLLGARDKIINRLKGLHGKGERIYARSTVVARIDKQVAVEFQEEHHLQGALPGKYRYGLFNQGELVSVAVFSGGRIMWHLGTDFRSFELIRFCHKGDRLVIGGLSKLLKAFIKEFKPQDIMTYADRDWCQDTSSLETLGFEVVDTTAPQRFAVVEGQRFSRVTEEQAVDYYIENKGSLKLKLLL